MHLADAVAIALVAFAFLAFFLGESALAHTEDLRALYWLGVGVAALRAATQVARPGAKA